MVGRPFQKGQSGNPSGRPKEDDEVKRLAREYCPESIEKLALWMRGDDPRASVSAANALLDRGYGKPVQAHAGADGESPLIPEDPATRDLAKAVLALLGKGVATDQEGG